MAEVAGHHDGRHRRFGWKAVAAAAIAGFLAGSTGLAAAGALPDPAQDVAHDVLDVVGIGVPRSTEGCPEGTTYRNHGEYVSSVEAGGGDIAAAAHSDCGKPARGKSQGDGKKEGTPRADTDGDPCTGPPPWAGAHLTPEERTAAQAERTAQCGPDDDDDAEESRAEADGDADLDEQPKAPEDVEETTTTTTEVAPETTTSTVPDTTTSTTGS